MTIDTVPIHPSAIKVLRAMHSARKFGGAAGVGDTRGAWLIYGPEKVGHELALAWRSAPDAVLCIRQRVKARTDLPVVMWANSATPEEVLEVLSEAIDLAESGEAPKPLPHTSLG